MKRITLLLIWLALACLGANETLAQEKPTCNPQSWGPNDTKKGEAKVITGMRTDLTAIHRTSTRWYNKRHANWKFLFQSSVIRNF